MPPLGGDGSGQDRDGPVHRIAIAAEELEDGRLVVAEQPVRRLLLERPRGGFEVDAAVEAGTGGRALGLLGRGPRLAGDPIPFGDLAGGQRIAGGGAGRGRRLRVPLGDLGFVGEPLELGHQGGRRVALAGGFLLGFLGGPPDPVDLLEPVAGGRLDRLARQRLGVAGAEVRPGRFLGRPDCAWIGDRGRPLAPADVFVVLALGLLGPVGGGLGRLAESIGEGAALVGDAALLGARIERWRPELRVRHPASTRRAGAALAASSRLAAVTSSSGWIGIATGGRPEGTDRTGVRDRASSAARIAGSAGPPRAATAIVGLPGGTRPDRVAGGRRGTASGDTVTRISRGAGGRARITIDRAAPVAIPRTSPSARKANSLAVTSHPSLVGARGGRAGRPASEGRLRRRRPSTRADRSQRVVRLVQGVGCRW